MHSQPAMQTARLAVLEGALLSLLRGAQEDGFDGITVDVTANDGITAIDVQYTVNGQPMAGESL